MSTEISAAPTAPNAGPGSRARSMLARSGSLDVRVFALASVFLTAGAYFVHGQLPWLVPFAGDFSKWLAHPRVAGPPVAPSRWPLGLLAATALLLIGAQLGALLLARTRLSRSRTATAGLALILGPAIAGFVATIAEVFGELRPSVLVGLTVAVGACTTGLWLPGRLRSAASARSRVGTLRLRPTTLWSAVAAVVLLIVIHVAMSPITEWDAIVYHAGTAKLWFEGRPSPPLVYGPSVGIEISGNYPPLFPATGAYFDVVLNHFDDFYLRLVPPLVFLGMLLLMHAYARLRFDRFVADWSVLLMLGAPMMVLYGSWPTAYIYLAALTLATVVLVDLAVQCRTTRAWAAAGVVAGLAELTHFFGALALGVGVVGFVVGSWWRRGNAADIGRLTLFVGVSLMIVSPWLIRNVLLLHNPVYPLGAPPLPGRGLVAPFWDASQQEIRNNSLGVWTFHAPKHIGLGLRARELFTAGLDRHLLLGGPLFAIVSGVCLARPRGRRMLYLAGCAVILVGVQLLPGWFWIRALVPAMPVCALLAACGLRELAAAAQSLHARIPLRSALLGMTACVTVGCGLALAIIGPDDSAWPTDLPPRSNFMQATEDLGSVSLTLRDVFGGDADAWTWLNGNVGRGRRVATLDNRLYYYRSPQMLFYLDGLEAAPLAHMTDAGRILRFLREHDVEYVFSPAWSFAPPTMHPLVTKLALFRLLGDREFPLVRLYSAGGYNYADEIYHVGPLGSAAQSRVSIPPAIFPGLGVRTPLVPLGAQRVSVPAGDTSPRLFVHAPSRPSAVIVQFAQHDPGVVSVNEYNYLRRRWTDGVAFAAHRSGARIGTLFVPLLPSSPSRIVDLGIYSGKSPTDISGVRVVPLAAPFFAVGGHVRPAGESSTVPKGRTDPRMFVPASHRTPQLLTFRYRGRDKGSLTVNQLRTSTNRWRYAIWSGEPASGGGWHDGAVLLPSTGDPVSILGFYARKGAFAVKDARVSPVARYGTYDGGYVETKALAAASGAPSTIHVVIPRNAVGVRFAIAPKRPGSVLFRVINVANGEAAAFQAVDGDTSRRIVELPIRSSEGRLVDVVATPFGGSLGITYLGPVTGNRPLVDAGGNATLALFNAGATDGRLFVVGRGRATLGLEYRTSGTGNVVINRLVSGRWTTIATLPATAGGWQAAQVALPRLGGLAELGVFDGGSLVQVRHLTVAYARSR